MRITNRYEVSDLSGLVGTWALAEGGEVIQGGDLPASDLLPGESELLALPLEAFQPTPGAEYWLTLTYALAEDASWAPAGHVIAWEQFAVPCAVPEAPAVSTDDMSSLMLEQTDRRVIVRGEGFVLGFDRARGTLDEWTVDDGRSLIASGPRLNVWRAPTDNDADSRGHLRDESRWRGAGLDKLVHDVVALEVTQNVGQIVRVRIETVLREPHIAKTLGCVYEYTIYGSGDVVIDTDVTPVEGLPTLPRVGLQLAVPGGYETMTWYGRGPHESYVDRKGSAAVGVYAGSVDEQYVPYVTPQENGNKTDVRWISLTNEEGCGLLAVAQPLLEVSAHHYSTWDLTTAKHLCELVRRERITLNLDWRQSGLGGASCGPATLPQYLIPAEPVRFAVRLRPLRAGDDAAALGRIRL